MKERLALDIDLWRNKSSKQIARELTSAFVEQGEASLEKQITFTLISPDEFRSLGLRWDTKIDWAENAACFKIRHWMDEQSDDFLLWISPPSGDYYLGCSFDIYQWATLANGEKKLGIWSITERYSPEDCVAIANQIQSVILGQEESFKDPELLRCSVTRFCPQNGQTWVDFLKRFFGSSEIWQAIENGEAKRLNTEIQEKSEEVIDDTMYERILQVRARKEQIWLGAQIERMMEIRTGRSFRPMGLCGSSNQMFLRQTEGIQTMISQKIITKVEIKNGQRVYECPICGADVKAGEKCPVSGCDWRAPQ